MSDLRDAERERPVEVNLRRCGNVLVKIGLVALGVAIAQTLLWPNAPLAVQNVMNVVFFFGLVTGFMPTVGRLLSRHWPKW